MPGVEILYIMYLLKFHVFEYNKYHYNKKFTYLLSLLHQSSVDIKSTTNLTPLFIILNPLPHMPILGSSDSTANKNQMSKIWMNWDSII